MNVNDRLLPTKIGNLPAKQGSITSDFKGLLSKLLLMERLSKSDKPLNIAISEFLVDLKLENKSPKTISYYKQHLVPFNNFTGNKNIHEVTNSDVKNYLITKTEFIYMLSGTFAAIRSFFNWCIRQEYCVDNPVSGIKAPKLPKRIIPTLSAESVNLMLTECSTKSFIQKRNKAMILFLYDSGVRVSELVGVKTDDIDLDTGQVKVIGKGNKQRIVRIGRIATKALWDYLKDHMGASPYLFLSEERRPLKADSVKHIIKAIGRKVGVDVHVHMFRHTFATEFLRSGGNIFDLQNLLGHSSLAMVQNYSRTLGSDDALKAHQQFSPGDRLLK